MSNTMEPIRMGKHLGNHSPPFYLHDIAKTYVVPGLCIYMYIKDGRWTAITQL